MENESKSFPVLNVTDWRSSWPYLVTLTDGVKLPAYPVVGLINEDGRFCIGESCREKMWYVSDKLIEHKMIADLENARIVDAKYVSDWQEIYSISKE